MRSFATSVGMTLHMVVIRGFGDHHIVEMGFKATGRPSGTRSGSATWS